jgi:sulfur carrier protein
MIVQHKVTVFANGKACQIDGTSTIGTLAASFKLEPKMVLVEYNGQALLRTEWEDKTLQHGDRIEFIRVVAGG